MVISGLLKSSSVLAVVEFCANQGGLLTTPTRSTPALRMASMRGLAPGGGGVCAHVLPMQAATTTATENALAQR
jgi:hypothetical protein